MADAASPATLRGYDAFLRAEPISNAPWGGAPGESAEWRQGWINARAGKPRPQPTQEAAHG